MRIHCIIMCIVHVLYIVLCLYFVCIALKNQTYLLCIYYCIATCIVMYCVVFICFANTLYCDVYCACIVYCILHVFMCILVLRPLGLHQCSLLCRPPSLCVPLLAPLAPLAPPLAPLSSRLASPLSSPLRILQLLLQPTLLLRLPGLLLLECWPDSFPVATGLTLLRTHASAQVNYIILA